MKKEELIKCFNEDKGTAKFKTHIAKLVDKLNKVSTEMIYAGVENDSLYVLDSEYHIFCSRTHIIITEEKQDPWLQNYYIAQARRTKKYSYNLKQLEKDVKELLKKYIREV